MNEYLITKNGWGDNCIMAFENKKYQYIRLFRSRKEAERYGMCMEKWHGYKEVMPWDVFCNESKYTF